jgi:hypothetical protein
MLLANKFAQVSHPGVGGQIMLSKIDDCRANALECLERAWRTRDLEAQLILLQDLARYWWRLRELEKIPRTDRS